MYLAAPVQEIYTGITIEIGEGRATVTLPVMKKFYHAANAIHGSVYFRLLDDAAYFAVNSLVEDVFMLTASFHIDIVRPVSEGELRAEGSVLSSRRNIHLASSQLFSGDGKLVARGKGTFMKSKVLLKDIKTYA